MLKELLGELFTPEIEAKLAGKQLAVVNDGSWLPKAKFDSVNEENKTLKEQIKTHEAQIAELGKTAGLSDELKKQITDIQNASAAATADLQKKLDEQALQHAIDRALDKAKAKNPKAVRALLDASKIKLDGETLLGLEDQLKALQTSDAYLFDTNTGGGGGANPPGGGGTTKNPYDRKAGTWNLTEQAKLEASNPTLAAQLAAAVGEKIHI
jgi:hypothetical protein